MTVRDVCDLSPSLDTSASSRHLVVCVMTLCNVCVLYAMTLCDVCDLLKI